MTVERSKRRSLLALTFIESKRTSLILNPYFSIPVDAILSFFALSGNILILFALQKDSNLHPPSKLLL